MLLKNIDEDTYKGLTSEQQRAYHVCINKPVIHRSPSKAKEPQVSPAASTDSGSGSGGSSRVNNKKRKSSDVSDASDDSDGLTTCDILPHLDSAIASLRKLRKLIA